MYAPKRIEHYRITFVVLETSSTADTSNGFFQAYC
jgi:hypothetical protein